MTRICQTGSSNTCTRRKNKEHIKVLNTVSWKLDTEGSQITLEVQLQTFEETECFNLTLYTDGIHFLDCFYTKTD